MGSDYYFLIVACVFTFYCQWIIKMNTILSTPIMLMYN